MIYLITTIFADVVGIALLGKAKGFERPWFLLVGLIFLAIGFITFSFATKTIPTAIANAIWCGMSIVLVVAVQRIIFNDAISLLQYAFLACILIGAVGLQLSGKG